MELCRLAPRNPVPSTPHEVIIGTALVQASMTERRDSAPASTGVSLMPTIAHHLNGSGARFGPDISAIMEDAYQRACKSLNAPLSVKKLLADAIFQLTQKGERDPEILGHKALASMLVEGECK
jgi:hypothetical protein